MVDGETIMTRICIDTIVILVVMILMGRGRGDGANDHDNDTMTSQLRMRMGTDNAIAGVILEIAQIPALHTSIGREN